MERKSNSVTGGTCSSGLEMDPPVFSDVVPERTVRVVGSELVENYTVSVLRRVSILALSRAVAPSQQH